MSYIKEIFDVTTFDQAKHTVLTTDPNNPDKFVNETNFLIDTIAHQNIVSGESMVLDYGCGMGRVSKQLVKRFGCNVVGIDISASMMQFANIYVSEPAKFKTTYAYNVPNSIDVCVSTFVLQHVQDPKTAISNIVDVLKPGGYLVLVNEPVRFVPSELDHNQCIIWKDDGFDVFHELTNNLTKTHVVKYLNSHVDVEFYRKPQLSH